MRDPEGARAMSGQWPEDKSVPSTPAGSPERRRPRWGLRTLGFLGLALLSMVTAISLGGYTFGTLGSLLFGLIGAGYCSMRGLAVALEHETFRTLMGRDRRR